RAIDCHSASAAKAYLQLARHHLATDAIDAARWYATQAKKRLPDDPEATLLQGRLELEANPRGALALCQTVPKMKEPQAEDERLWCIGTAGMESKTEAGIKAARKAFEAFVKRLEKGTSTGADVRAEVLYELG